MTTTFPQQPRQQDTPPPAFPDLSTLSTLWVPLHEVRQAWAAFGKEALTTSALMATSTAFGGLYWEAHALQHCTWAADEQERGRWHRVVFWFSRAVQDLDCALDRWQQVQSMLDLAGNDHRQQDPESLETVRTLMAQVQWPRAAAVLSTVTLGFGSDQSLLLMTLPIPPAARFRALYGLMFSEGIGN